MITPDANFAEFSQTLNALFKPLPIILRLFSGLLSFFLGLAIILAWPTDASTAAVVAALSLVAYSLLCQRVTTARRRALFNGWKSERAVLTFSRGGIATQSQFGSGETAWSSFNRLVETKDTYMLVRRSFAYVCIPKRDIPNDRSQEFVELLRESIVSAEPAA
ncbi:MAG: YcxB family protein [Candidatus Cybelea sp.]